MDFTTILQPKYWLSLTPAPLSSLSEKLLLAFFTMVFVVGIVLRFVERRKNISRFKARAFYLASQLGLTMGAVGLLIFFFSFENVRLFGARFWYLFWVIGVVVWLVYILRDYYKVSPKKLQNEEKRRQREKYLPKKKKK
ncbi:MAG: hypothetical protein UX09_C0031G0005 [Candidatus Uhrbacteria bacterium GW2011_GWE2_45_35]|uniref:Uncharacterized protein n=2 Tax=Candidatus Uhriibacteriota TaxID=1752732 RepID=A0A0G1LME9_9BACT|nr:MAG: hypothetical protein UW63_C0041G0005 [Candidatus Uhrbacteria bacterium GW2011_GWF2_44_350]KKU07309.1 MAG: hypothetical protein UX09_C0031G0005 [Candidatus Uhrbacteria bacterium GW2011_GWE2_45_35]HBR80811.1 hypothetical protein [Candidatus Uhrbacteria bacterium]HCU31382.1 hypothetical protein [Candidatus Uhrbacteria bacterium]